MSEVGFDETLRPGNVQFLTPLWLEKYPVYFSAEKVITKPEKIAISYFISDKKLTLNKAHSFDQYGIYTVEKKANANHHPHVRLRRAF